jgi:hypothetical protein
MEKVTFEHGQEVTIILGDGQPLKAKWMVAGAGIAPFLKLEDSVEVIDGGSLTTNVDVIHIRP